MWCRVLLAVQRNFLLRLRLGDDRRQRPFSVCISFLDPWSRVDQLHQPVHDRFFLLPQPVVRIQTNRLSTSLQFFSDMLRCELAVAPDQISGSGTEDNLHLDPIVRSLFCESTSSLRCSGVLLTFTVRVLIASPCSVTTTASDDEFKMPIKLQDGVRLACTSSALQISGSVFCPFVGLVCAAVSFRRCQCHTCSSSMQ